MRIVKIEMMDDYKIGIWLGNGMFFSYDFEAKVKTARFWELQDIELFKTAELVAGKIIRWNDMMEISIDEMI